MSMRQKKEVGRSRSRSTSVEKTEPDPLDGFDFLYKSDNENE